MFLLAYRSSKHEMTGVTPAELYFGRYLNLPLDLLQGSPPNCNSSETIEEYVQDLRKKLDEIHQKVRKRLNIKSYRTKGRYDQKGIYFSNSVNKFGYLILVGVRVELQNYRIIGKAPMR